MRIQLLNGGLGNQLFQYIFVRFAERYYPDDLWFFDDSDFFVSPHHNGYEIEKIWNVKPKLLSDYFDQDVWGEIIRLRKEGISLPQIFLNMGFPLSMIAETTGYSFNGRIFQINANEFHPEIAKFKDGDNNIYYHGYWINKHWFSEYKEENLSELAFPKLIDKRNLRYANAIDSCLSVGIHIRRGDFVTLGLALPASYYQTACKTILDHYPSACFFVFTDNVSWCKENSEILGLNLASQTIYVLGTPEREVISMLNSLACVRASSCQIALFATLLH